MVALTDLAAALDPVHLARRAGLELDDWQAAVVRSPAPRMLLNASRQSGKSQTTAVLALHTALYQPESLVLLLSPSLRQSGELFRKVLDVYGAVGRPVPAEAETKLTLELENASRVVSLPGREATVRGFSKVALLCIDEASRVDDALYQAVRPFLAVSGGRLVALSTPWGKRGWWYEAWAHGGEAWARWEIPATRCPRIPAGFLEEERLTLPPLLYQSEYLCRFTETTDRLFADADIEAALAAGAGVPSLFPGGRPFALTAPPGLPPPLAWPAAPEVLPWP